MPSFSCLHTSVKLFYDPFKLRISLLVSLGILFGPMLVSWFYQGKEKTAGIVQGAPWWSWLILVLLVYFGIRMGLRGERRSTVSSWRMGISPVLLFMATCYFLKNVLLQNLLASVLSLSAGGVLGTGVARQQRMPLCPECKMYVFPSDYFALPIFVLFFVIKFSFGYLTVVQPQHINTWSVLELTVSMLVTGYFLGVMLTRLRQILFGVR